MRGGRKTYHLGNFETEEEAARGYDNVLHYAGEYGFTQRTALNFPQDYAEQPLPMTDTTRRIILDCCGRLGAQDPKRLNKAAAKLAPLLRELAELLPELEGALSTRATDRGSICALNHMSQGESTL